MRQAPAPTMTALRARMFAAALACLGAGVAHAEDTDGISAAALRAKYVELQDRLSDNPFQKPLYMDSSETPGAVTGEVYARINYPFAMTDAALNGPARWCEILILHVNTKFCRSATDNRGSVLQVNIGKKHDQPVDEA